MSGLSLADSLSHGPCVAAAKAACERYQTVLGLVLIIEAAAGIALLTAPHSVSRLVLDAPPGPAGFTRLAGLLLLLLVALLFAARAYPARAKIANVARRDRARAGGAAAAARRRLADRGGRWPRRARRCCSASSIIAISWRK